MNTPAQHTIDSLQKTINDRWQHFEPPRNDENDRWQHFEGRQHAANDRCP